MAPGVSFPGATALEPEVWAAGTFAVVLGRALLIEIL